MFLTNIHRPIYLFVVLYLGLQSWALGCDCANSPFIDKFSHAKYVIAGKIQSSGANYNIVTVTKVWKGQLPKEIVIVEPFIGCGSPMSGHFEYILFLHSGNETENYRQEIKTTKPTFEVFVCGGHPVRDKIWDTFLNELVGLSNVQYELEGIIKNKEFYQGIWKISDTLIKRHILPHSASIHNALGREIDLRINIENNSVKVLFEKSEISSGWYFFRYRSGSLWITLPFAYYEERIYSSYPEVIWQNWF